MNKYNIIWILVDSVRRYHCDKDDRGRLEVMDKFGLESIEFLKTVTSAPSTMMSISAMMTSMPSYFISRNYIDFQFDSNNIPTLNHILKSKGYNSYGFYRHWETRTKCKNLLDPIDRKFWPTGFKHHQWWSNEDINKLLKELLKKGIETPALMFFDYNCRLDPNISKIVEELLETLKGSNFNENNSIFILCSDHGYPDPSRGLTTKELIRRNLTHDLILTDDNILIPLLIKYPGCLKAKKIATTVSSLDIMPTILDILDIKLDKTIIKNFKGHSLLPLINGDIKKYKEIKVRSDARFLAQKGRTTAIRGQRYKYIYHHDIHVEEFFDSYTDKWENNNIINSNDKKIRNKIDEYRKEFEKQEKEAIEFHFKFMLSHFKKNIKEINKVKVAKAKILLLGSCEKEYIKLLFLVIRESFSNSTIDLLIDEIERNNIPKLKFRKIVHYKFNKVNSRIYKKEYKDFFHDLYDLVVIPYDSQKKEEYKNMIKLSRYIKKKKVITLDYNMNFYKKKPDWYLHLKLLYSKKEQFIEEPSFFFYEMFRLTRAALGKIKRMARLKKEDWDFSNLK